MRPAALELKIPPVVLWLLTGLVIWGVARAGPALHVPLPGRRVAAALLALAGVAIGVAGVAAFRLSRTTVDPRRPDAATSLVTGGPYRWSRNPMYLGLLLMLAGWALYLSSPLALVLLPAFVAYMNRFQIEPEERAMRLKYGRDYEAYTRSVRRWI
jgi:protein-S-isoprenylcysteine O-methyltransferase Ste14